MDKYLVSLAFLLLFFEGAWLTYDLNPRAFNLSSKINTTDPIAKILKVKSQVRTKSQDSLVWEDGVLDDALYAYDSVLTLSQSATEIELQGDSHIFLGENTMVVIEPPANGQKDGPLRLRFKKGRMTTMAGSKPQTLETSDFIVEATAQTKMSLRSQIVDGDEKFQIETVSGSVTVSDSKNEKPEQIINTGESIEIFRQKISRQPAASNLVWNLPLDNSRFYTHESFADVGYEWTGNVSAIEINGKILSLNNTNTFSQKLAVGSYTVKLLAGESVSQTRIINVWPAPKIFIISPIVRQRFKKADSISFLWMQTAGVKKYKLELSQDQHFKLIEKSVETNDLGTSIPDLSSGHWYWRVRGADDSGFEIPELYNGEFYILEKPLEPPKLKKPKIKKGASNQKNILEALFNLLIPSAQAAPVTAEFQWEKLEGAVDYVVEISEDPDFRNPIVSARVKNESYKWPNFKLGHYYWRVAGVDNTNQIGIYSDSDYVDLTQIPSAPIVQGMSVKTPILPRRPLQLPPKPLLKTETVTANSPPEKNPLFVIPRLPQFDFTKPWNTSVEFGIHGGYQVFKGGDFNAQDLGFVPADFRVITSPQTNDDHKLRGELELHFLRLKIRTPTTYPFQDPLNAFTFRFMVIDHEKYGLGINQYLGFKRTDLEALGFQSFLTIGPVLQLDRHRLGLYIGQAYVLDYSYKYQIQKNWSETKNLIYAIEGRSNFGLTLNRNLFYDVGLFLWFGVQWK